MLSGGVNIESIPVQRDGEEYDERWICCPAIMNFVRHSCLDAWKKIHCSSIVRSRIRSDCRVGMAESMVERQL